MKIEHPKQMDELKQHVFRMVWFDVKNTPDDSRWREYKKDFVYKQGKYTVTFSYRLNNSFLTHRNFKIVYSDQKEIILPPNFH